MWPGRIALVRAVMAASISAGSMPHESGSMSTNTGMALCCSTAMAVATNE
jgi:hypothetical protein